MKAIISFLILISTFVLMSCEDKQQAVKPIGEYTTIENLLSEIGFQGYAIVTKAGEDLVRKGFGLANKASGLLQSFQREYRIGSVSKTLSAAAVVQLKREGLITSFSQVLSEFDADFPEGAQITIAQLLSHQSGIPEYQLIVERAYERGNALAPDEIYEVIKALIAEDGLNFTPGTSKQYTNSNYLIAALLVEALSGKTYHEYVQERILAPLGMHHTHRGTDLIDADIHAEGYQNGAPNSTYPIAIPFGAGDFSSTPEDMEKWTDAVKNDWFSTAEKAEIFAEEVPSGFVDFGMGWFTTQENTTTMYWHGGDINGYWSMIGFVPEFDATIVLLSNQQADLQGSQRNTIIEQLMNKEFK